MIDKKEPLEFKTYREEYERNGEENIKQYDVIYPEGKDGNL